MIILIAGIQVREPVIQCRLPVPVLLQDCPELGLQRLFEDSLLAIGVACEGCLQTIHRPHPCVDEAAALDKVLPQTC